MAQWQELIGTPAREVCLGGEIIFGSGASVSLDGGRAVELTIQEGADGAIGPGDVLSASIVLDLNNDAGQWRAGGSLLGAQELIGATLMPRLGVRNGDGVLWRPLGVFQVESAMELEQQARLRLRGADNIAMVLGDAFEDDAQAYPTTLAQLWRRAAAQGGSSFVGEVPNGTATIDAAPDWQGASLRGAMGCIAAAAGCFVRLSRMGALELCRVWDPQAQPRAIGAQQYLTLQLGAEHYGPVDALRLRPVGGETDTEIVYRTGESALHTLAISDNPLFQADAAHLNALAQGTLSQLAGYAGGAAQFEWRGDPELQVGARIALTDAHGRAFSGIISRQTMRYSGGFRAECACVLPESADSGVRRAITPEGRLNAAALTGALNGAMLSAGSVTTNKLAAGSVTADKIAAGAVDAISINAVKARLAEITAEDIETDELAAELARITVLIAGTAAFDAATIRHLVSEAMNLEYGVAGQVFIKNLAVEYAQMVGATIGNLCIKASDGKYYLLDVGADGKVTAAETTVTDGEIEAGQTSGGSVIVETNITAANLTTTNLLATYALINKIDAARIDVDELVARRTFTDALYTSKIYGGKSLELIVGDVEKAQETAGNAATWRVEIISGGGQVLNGASSVTLSAHLYYGETEYTDRISATAFSWRRSSDGDGENSDAVWAATHTGMKQITVSAGDVDYNAVYTCDVDYKHIIDVDYEAFELSGNPVVCEPYADYPLDITAVWAPERVYGNANLLDFDGIILFENSDGCTCEIVGKTVVFGNYANANDRFVCSAWIDVEANTDYSVSCKSASIGQYYIYTDKLFGTLVKAVSNNAPTFNSGNNTRVLIGFYSIKTDRVGDVDTLSEFKVEQGTSVTTYIPYGASCNIVGRASVDVTRCGANILQYTPPASGTLNGIQWTVDGNRISISGTPTADCYILLAGGYGGTKYGYPPMIAPGETYTLSRYTQVYFYKKDGTSIAPRGTTFVAPPSEDVKTYGIFVSVFAADGAVDATIQPTIAVGAQSNPNEVPYTGETKTLVLSHEVYGGTVNADGSCTETWGSIESYAGETLPGEWMSDRGDITSGTAGGTAVPATGAHVVYKLTTPVEMTAAGGGEIAALDGVNTILTNADSLTVKGRTNERAVLA